MGISPMRKGATLPPIDGFFIDDSGNTVPLTNLTNTNLSLTIYNLDTQVELPGLGAWQIINSSTGEAQYFWDSADTANVGRFEVRAAITYPSGGVRKFDPQEVVIL